MTDPENNEAIRDHLFRHNREWAASIVARQPDFFKKLELQQAPEYFWIGCSDSRVPANELLGLMPGELFVHRNVANVVSHSDLNCLSVLQFAVDVLKVKHVFVVGHYGCSGVHAAVSGKRVGLADNWLRHVRDVSSKYDRYLGESFTQRERGDRICELNAMEQAGNLCQTTIVQDAWDRGQPLTIHAWVYGVHDGLLRDLEMTVSAYDELDTRLKAALQRYETAPDHEPSAAILPV